ncbi:hypothetical protein [Smaragdicoccus niigatensis]|uniref:hypothetical protein n=1 Tax=Smaragdicoccus niigatensis TaxID=359359 RepID=UPI00035FEAB1|nr:hypothetical protein [Smaragdicoccus niigatensis]
MHVVTRTLVHAVLATAATAGAISVIGSGTANAAPSACWASSGSQFVDPYNKSIGTGSSCVVTGTDTNNRAIALNGGYAQAGNADSNVDNYAFANGGTAQTGFGSNNTAINVGSGNAVATGSHSFAYNAGSGNAFAFVSGCRTINRGSGTTTCP